MMDQWRRIDLSFAKKATKCLTKAPDETRFPRPIEGKRQRKRIIAEEKKKRKSNEESWKKNSRN